MHNSNCVALDLKSGIPRRYFEIPQRIFQKLIVGQSPSEKAHGAKDDAGDVGSIVDAGRQSHEHLLPGEARATFKTSSQPDWLPDGQWGYVATQGDRLYGSSQSASASIIGQNRPKIMAFSYGDNRPIAVSHSVFCLDRHTGKTLWTYGTDGKQRIVNPSITLSDTAMVFIESTHPDVLLFAEARIPANRLLVTPHTYLVKRDAHTGIELWRQPVALPFHHMLYLQIAKKQQMIIASGARDQDKKIHYDVVAFNLDSGQKEWSCLFNTGMDSGASHGEQEQHPVISSGTLYTKYFTVDLRTGNPKAFSLSHPNGGGCGTLSACATHIFGRAGNPFMYSHTQAIRLTKETRPGCWINMYPVGGLVLIPESSSGCTCDFPVQATLAFQPID